MAVFGEKGRYCLSVYCQDPCSFWLALLPLKTKSLTQPRGLERVHGELRSSFLIHANAKEFKGATLRFLETYFPWHMNHYPEDDGKYYYSKVKR